MLGISSPCKNCEDRVFMCHSSCLKYEKFKIDVKEYKEWQLKEKEIEDVCINKLAGQNRKIMLGKKGR